MGLSLFCYALLYVHDSSAMVLERKGKLIALPVLSYRCLVTVNVVRLFLTALWVGLQCLIVVFPDHTHLLFLVILRQQNCKLSTSYFTAIKICNKVLLKSI